MRRVEGLNFTFDFTLMWRRRSASAVARRFIEVVKSLQADRSVAGAIGLKKAAKPHAMSY